MHSPTCHLCILEEKSKLDFVYSWLEVCMFVGRIPTPSFYVLSHSQMRLSSEISWRLSKTGRNSERLILFKCQTVHASKSTR